MTPVAETIPGAGGRSGERPSKRRRSADGAVVFPSYTPARSREGSPCPEGVGTQRMVFRAVRMRRQGVARRGTGGLVTARASLTDPSETCVAINPCAQAGTGVRNDVRIIISVTSSCRPGVGALTREQNVGHAPRGPNDEGTVKDVGWRHGCVVHRQLSAMGDVHKAIRRTAATEVLSLPVQALRREGRRKQDGEQHADETHRGPEMRVAEGSSVPGTGC